MYLLKMLTRLIANDNKKMLSMNSRETFAYGMRKDLACQKLQK